MAANNPADQGGEFLHKLLAGLLLTNSLGGVASLLTAPQANNGPSLADQISQGVANALNKSRVDRMNPVDRAAYDQILKDNADYEVQQKALIKQRTMDLWFDKSDQANRDLFDKNPILSDDMRDIFQSDIDEYNVLKRSGRWGSLTDAEKDWHQSRRDKANVRLGASDYYKQQIEDLMKDVTAANTPELSNEVGALFGSADLAAGLSSGSLVAPALLTAVALGGVAITAKKLQERFDEFARDLGDISGPIAGTLARNEIRMMQAKLDRASVTETAGSIYLDATGRIDVVFYKMGTEFFKLVGPLIAEIASFVAKAFEDMYNLYEVTGIKLITDLLVGAYKIMKWLESLMPISPLSALNPLRLLSDLKRQLDMILKKLFGAGEGDIDKLLGDIDGLKGMFPKAAFPDGLK